PQGSHASWPETDLMSQRDLAPIARRFENRQADLERRHRPFAVVQRRLAMHDRVVEFVDDFGAWNCRPGQRLQARLAVAVDHHAGRQWAQVRPVAGNEHDAEMLVPSCGRGDSSWRPILGTAVVARLLERGFLYRIRRALQVPACRPVRARVLRRAELADAAAEFVGVEMSVTAVD